MTYKKMSYISGIIVFIALVIFFSSILWLSGQHIFFSKKYILYFKFSDVVGLRDRSLVFLRGYRVGWTKDVDFENDRVIVQVDIKKKFKIPDDSRVEINTLNFIGEKAVTITPGTSKNYLEPYSIVDGTNRDIMILARNILMTARKELESGDLDVKIKEVSRAIDGFHTLMQNMNRTVKKIDLDLVNHQFKAIGTAGKDLKEFLTTAGEDTRQFTIESSETLERLNRTLEELSKTSTEFREIARKINKGQGTAGELVTSKEFLEKINRTLSELNAFLADIKKHPKKYVRFSIF
jgi:phospholipid/cholesterol/gamma-HCH transport system substrate-binding protein